MLQIACNEINNIVNTFSTESVCVCYVQKKNNLTKKEEINKQKRRDIIVEFLK